MKKNTVDDIKLSNPWLSKPHDIIDFKHYRPRAQSALLLSKEWDDMWLTLIGPRRAGKTTLGKFIATELIKHKRFDASLYLNCDYASVRNELITPQLIIDLVDFFQLNRPVIFIDEAQRLENAGLILKSIIDLGLNYKFIASGSSQLEIKSKISEHLTGRQFEYLVMPMSVEELNEQENKPEERMLFGSYPRVIDSKHPELILNELYRDYIRKDIIEILQVAKPHVIEKLLTLLAHQSGQLVNYQQLSTDCEISTHILKNYLAILQETYIIKSIRPFVSNKRTEVTSNPIIYFLDNGFRNQSLLNFNLLVNRTDAGLLAESYVFQELYKLITQKKANYKICYWRTKSGAEVDFILVNPNGSVLPIEVKCQNMDKAKVTRSLRSFISHYKPSYTIVITKNFYGKINVDNSLIEYFPISDFAQVIKRVINKSGYSTHY